MLLSRLSIADRARSSPEFWQSFSGEYELHQEAWSLFGDHPERRRDFLYRLDSHHGKPLLWTLSDREPQPSSALWRIETKRIEPQLRHGDLLEFQVRVNPVVSREGRRHDVVMDRKVRTGWRSQPVEERDSQATVVHEALREWLDSRSDRLGGRVQRLRADGYRVARFRKPSGKAVHLGLCDLSGVLEIGEPSSFLKVWRAGLGPAKGFGCGLLLIRRAR